MPKDLIQQPNRTFSDRKSLNVNNQTIGVTNVVLQSRTMELTAHYNPKGLQKVEIQKEIKIILSIFHFYFRTKFIYR